MITVHFKPSFLKQFNKFSVALQDEIEEKIELFKKDPTHPSLKSHKLRGRLKGRFSFSVNYRIRIVFACLSKKDVVLLSVGGHDVYQK
ncbi:MAG: type II toxin-antitoxin system mRNA interferase toxin, RelE/StbE family [Nitrospirae bacterium]|nr:type II toxin-antitoxin system mRNA interferase toxin, RelE/StbE family [Nitrospirota bacterium]